MKYIILILRQCYTTMASLLTYTCIYVYITRYRYMSQLCTPSVYTSTA